MYQELISSMIGVGTITMWGLFKMMCTGMEVAEFNNILFKASGKNFEFIQENFNKKICLVDENSEEFNAWKEENDLQKLESQGNPVAAYSCSFPLSVIRPPPERAPAKKLVRWNASCIHSIDDLAWLNLHKHGW